MRITARSTLNDWGKERLCYLERVLDEERVEIVAFDAHGTEMGRPMLTRAHDVIARAVGTKEARAMVQQGLTAVLADLVIGPVGRFREAGPSAPDECRSLGRLDRWADS